MFKIAFYLSLIVIIGCSGNNDDSIIPEIDVENNVGNFEKLQLSDYIDDVQYIPLDTDPILLRRIYQLDFYNELIAVRDIENCILYDSSGSYITKIGNRGQGPGEYMYSTNIRIGRNGKIYIQDYRGILMYDLNGKFIRKFDPEINTNFYTVISWSIYNDSLFLGQIPNRTGEEEYKAVIFNDRGETIKTFQNWIFLNRKGIIARTPFEDHANIYQFNGKAFFKEIMNDTLFFINDQYLLEPAYHFNLGKYGEPFANRELEAVWKSVAFLLIRPKTNSR